MGAHSGRAGWLDQMIGNETVVSVVRLATPDDKAEIDGLLDALFPDDPNRLTDEEFDTLAPGKSLCVLLAEFDGCVCGFTVLRERAFRPWSGIDFVGVAGHSINRGIGRKLMQAAIGHSPRLMLRLFVHASNAPAIKLYKHMGFSHISTKVRHYPNGEDALVMMRWIGPKWWRALTNNGTKELKNDNTLP